MFLVSFFAIGCSGDDNDVVAAAPFEITYRGQVLPDKATVVCDSLGQESQMMVCTMFVINNADSMIEVKLEKEILSKTPANVAQINTFCWGQCMTESVYQSTHRMPAEGTSPKGELFTGDLMTSTLPAGRTEIAIRYTFTHTASSFSCTVTINFVCNK